MGIPVYFKNITQKYPHIIVDIAQFNKTCTHLFLDFNGLIHPCVNNVLLQYKSKTISKEKLELLFFSEIKNYLFTILKKVNPTKLVYISIDGVAPRAKMIQQRKRRFRSVQQKNIIDQIYKKYNITINTKWDTNAITPGTQFMNDLSKFLHTINFGDYNFDIIISDASYEGEGEHKILQYMKTHFKNNDETNNDETNNENENENENKENIMCKDNNYFIYGLDADLIMLSMASKVDNIYLLREAVHFGKVNQDKLLLLNIDILKTKLYEDIINKIGISQIKMNMIIQDYIFLCFLIGNDFLPNIPGITIKNNGIELLLQNYIELVIKRKECLLYDSEINLGFLKDLFIKLLQNENTLVNNERLNYEKKRFFCKNANNKLEEELEKLKFLPLTKKKTLLYKIQQGTEGWRDRYYYHLFHIKNKNQLNNNILELCQNYLEGIVWNVKYYFDKCCCWNWHYMYLHSPCLHEIVDNFEACFDKIKFTEENSQIYSTSPFLQLLNVLPPQSSHLLPPSYAKLMTDKNSPIYHYYPKQVSLDYYLCTYYHECEPKLPNIDKQLVIQSIKNIKLSKKEKLLNKKNE